MQTGVLTYVRHIQMSALHRSAGRNTDGSVWSRRGQWAAQTLLQPSAQKTGRQSAFSCQHEHTHVIYAYIHTLR